jgi:transmembrane sensor
MTSSITSHPIPAAIIDAAIEWTIKLDFNSPSTETRRAFECWLQAAPLHRDAWLRVQSLRGDFATLPPLLALDTLQAATQLRSRETTLRRRQLLKLLGVATVTAGAAWQSREALPWQRLVADASTGVGQQRSLRLGDGTIVMLNTDTALSTVGDTALQLRRGEIFVAGDAAADIPLARQLRIQTPAGEVHAPGANFVVRLAADRARITVQQGLARLYPAGFDGAVLARGGESWWLGPGGARPAEPLPFDAAGWVEGVVAAKNMPLADLLAELERYRRGRIACDARVAKLPVSGIYHVRDTDRALRFLAQTQSLRLSYRTRFWVSVERAAT